MPNTPPAHHNTPPLATEKVDAREQGKEFFLDLNENDRGRVLRFKERNIRAGRHDIIMIPIEALREIGELFITLADWSDKNP